MTRKLCFLIFIIVVDCYIVLTNEECQFIENNDLIDDCNCFISDLNELNNQRLYPLLHKKCQFWTDHGQCSLRTCAIKPCLIEKLRDKISCSTVDTNASLDSINKNLTEEYKQTIENSIQFDDRQSEIFCDVDDERSIDLEYIDLSKI
jgi:hypothetical protein